jgi:hypothetical protein
VLQVQLAALCAAEPGTSRAEHLRAALEAGLRATAPHVDLSSPPPGFSVTAWADLSKVERQHAADLLRVQYANERVIANVMEQRAAYPAGLVPGSTEHILHLNAVRDDAATCRAMAVAELAAYAGRG